MTRLAVFSALVWLETGIRDMTIDTYVTLRRRAELRGMFGPLINQAVIRLCFTGDTSLSRWVLAVRAEIVDLDRHGWIPFDLLMRDLHARGVRPPILGTRFQIDEEPDGQVRRASDRAPAAHSSQALGIPAAGETDRVRRALAGYIRPSAARPSRRRAVLDPHAVVGCMRLRRPPKVAV